MLLFRGLQLFSLVYIVHTNDVLIYTCQRLPKVIWENFYYNLALY